MISSGIWYVVAVHLRNPVSGYAWCGNGSGELTNNPYEIQCWECETILRED